MRKILVLSFIGGAGVGVALAMIWFFLHVEDTAGLSISGPIDLLVVPIVYPVASVARYGSRYAGLLAELRAIIASLAAMAVVYGTIFVILAKVFLKEIGKERSKTP